jgi:hypothetical protein
VRNPYDCLTGDFGFVVEAFHDTARDQLLSSEVAENEFAMQAQRAGDLLHRFDAGTHGLSAPLVEELAGPCRRVVIPELLECFLEKVSSDRPEVVAEEVAEPEVLVVAEILTAFEQQPTRLLQDGLAPFALHAASLRGADLVALFIFATIWKGSRIWSASEHFSRMALRYGSHMSEQTNAIRETTSSPMAVKNP